MLISVVVRRDETKRLGVKFAGDVYNHLLSHSVEAAVAAHVRLLVEGELATAVDSWTEGRGILR